MLITRRGADLVLVDQNEHGRLAGDLTLRWGNPDFDAPTRRDQVRLATARHDDGWLEADAEPLYNAEARRPLHFLEIPLEEHLPLYQRGVDRIYQEDPYAGLLVSMHWTGLYRNRWGLQEGGVGIAPTRTPLDEIREKHVAEEERRWTETKKSLVTDGIRSDFEARLWHHYDLLQIWDLFSLYVSLADITPADTAPVPLARTLKSVDQTPGPRVIQRAPSGVCGSRADIVLTPIRPGVVTVDPFPFDSDVVASLDARVIPDRAYGDRTDVDTALADAERTTLECRFTKG
ncbi:DUF3891 family protein [Pseudonocardia spinosispora]|uniref:DUF3891 family protein n=1 Tax=Pseudonocardia spinosispora TaxID=103441 RepID=UPI000410B038|nr:DUF3891 family protein [Pseudonocardia spinosispora]